MFENLVYLFMGMLLVLSVNVGFGFYGTQLKKKSTMQTILAYIFVSADFLFLNTLLETAIHSYQYILIGFGFNLLLIVGIIFGAFLAKVKEIRDELER